MANQFVSRRNTQRARLSALFVFGLCVSACGDASQDRPPPAPSGADLELPDLGRYDAATADSRDVVASGGCEDGATRECRIYLPSHGGVQPCFVGVQECRGAAWAECSDAVLVDANANDTAIETDDSTP
jgi:hypothetical protein